VADATRGRLLRRPFDFVMKYLGQHCHAGARYVHGVNIGRREITSQLLRLTASGAFRC